MKKLFLLVLLFQGIWAKAQEKNCLIDEYVLLKEKPAELSDRQALQIIRGEKERIDFYTKSKYRNKSMFPQKIMEQKYVKYVYLSKTSGLPEWKETTPEISGKELIQNDWQLQAGWVIMFLLAFFFGTVLINLFFDTEFSDNPFKWLLHVIWISFLVGVAACSIYVAQAEVSVLKFTYYLSFVCVSIAGGLMWGVCLFLFDYNWKDERIWIKQKLGLIKKQQSFS